MLLGVSFHLPHHGKVSPDDRAALVGTIIQVVCEHARLVEVEVFDGRHCVAVRDHRVRGLRMGSGRMRLALHGAN